MQAMKVVVLAMMGMASAAYAQSSVTVWGRVGGGVEYLGNIKTGANSTGSRWSEGSNWGVSILGFKGAEDLGDGDQALFWLEHAFNSANGNQNGGKMWQRGAWVGLKSQRFGLLRLGQGNFINNYIWRFDPFYLEDYSASSMTSYRNGPRLPNGIRYESPSFGGFEFALQLNAGKSLNSSDGPADAVVTTGKAYGLSAAYVAPEFEVRAIHDVIHNTDGKVDDLFRASQETFLGAKFNVSASAAVRLGWSHYAAPDAAAGLSRKANHVWAGVNYRPIPLLELQAAVYSMKVGEGSWTKDRPGEGRGTMLTLGSMYDLSKRTFLYAALAHVNNSANANFSVRPSPLGYGDPVTGNGTSPAAGSGQTGMFAGVMHNF